MEKNKEWGIHGCQIVWDYVVKLNKKREKERLIIFFLREEGATSIGFEEKSRVITSLYTAGGYFF